MCVYRKKVSLTLNNRNRTMKNRTSYEWRKFRVVGCKRIRMKLTSQEGRSPPVHLKPDLLLFCRGGEGSLETWDMFAPLVAQRHMASKLNQDVHNKFLFMVLFKTSQWEWPNLLIPLSARQWLGNSKWWSIILSTMERLPQTLHTYIQPNSPRGRHKQRQHIAAYVATTLPGHWSH